jgi:hypothetical protein
MAGVLLLAAAQAADYLTFLTMVGVHGLSAEVNPVVVSIASQGSGALALAKAAAIVIVAGAFLAGRRRRPRTARFTLGTGIVMGLIGALSNIATI